MGRRYQHPPIIEALCEFQFEPSPSWDLTVPGLVFERIKGHFPHKRPGKAIEVNVVAGPEGVKQMVSSADRMQFLNANETSLVQVAKDLLVVNQLKPYVSWRAFLPLIEMGYDAFREEANPKAIHRIGLRYINRVEIPLPSVDLADYFEFLPSFGPRLPQTYRNFIAAAQFPFDDERDALRLQIASVVSETSNSTAVMLDLNYALARPTSVALENPFTWVEQAHVRIEEVFEACIRDSLRALFVEEVE